MTSYLVTTHAVCSIVMPCAMLAHGGTYLPIIIIIMVNQHPVSCLYNQLLVVSPKSLSYFTIMKMSSVLFLLSCLLIEGVMSQTGLTATEEQEILNRHNILRGQVSPSASNMERMV